MIAKYSPVRESDKSVFEIELIPPEITILYSILLSIRDMIATVGGPYIELVDQLIKEIEK